MNGPVASKATALARPSEAALGEGFDRDLNGLFTLSGKSRWAAGRFTDRQEATSLQRIFRRYLL